MSLSETGYNPNNSYLTVLMNFSIHMCFLHKIHSLYTTAKNMFTKFLGLVNVKTLNLEFNF